MKFSARVLILFVFLGSLFLLFTKNSFAQTSVVTEVKEGEIVNTKQYSPNLESNVPKDQRTYVQSTVIELLAATVCQLGGYDPVRQDHKCLGVEPTTGKIGFVENGGGALGVMGTLIAATFVAPTSSGQYINYLAGNFGVAKNTYAQEPRAGECAGAVQGVGFCGIRPLLEIWVAMRNIAYLLFVIIFVLIGLAIMFRVHIDPRTVMTIENQIPKIIMGIVLVTFSFAIAGLLIDVMYVALYLVGGVLASIPGHEIGNLGQITTSPTPFDAINRLWPGDPSDDLGAGFGGGFPELALQGSDTMRNLVMNALNGSPTGRGNVNFEPGLFDFVGNLFTAVVGLIVGLASALIIFLALIYTAIRLWIILITAYINILLDIIFAPFWILIGLFPGSSSGVSPWFKDMLANLAVFPTAMSMFILGKVFSDIASDPQNTVETGTLFIPPLVGGGTGDSSQIFAGVIALGFLFMTPHVLQITRGAIKAPNINYGPVFQPAGEAGGTIGSGISTFAAMNAKVPLPGQKGGREALMRRILKF
ncbi:MAG: hypothetical protein KBD51_00460 [Candidatus Levybacteria bacterium]|nr:hypothetical protein [Candidatus Levybacteria bacterium]